MTCPQHAATLADLLDRAAISDTVLAYGTGVDRRDWALYRSIFADEVEFDFSTWNGWKTRMKADDWVAAVRETLSGFDATQHNLTNHVITLHGDTADITVHMTARHYLVVDGVGQTQILGGFYQHKLARAGARWQITHCSLVITWMEGDMALFDKAKALGPRARVDVGMQGV